VASQRLAPGDASGRKDHGSARAQQAFLLAIVDNDARDARRRQLHAFDAHRCQQIDVQVAQRPQLACRQRVAEIQAGASVRAQALAHVPRGQPGRVPEGARRTADAAQRRQVRTADHHAPEEHELRQRITQQREVGSEQSAFEGHRLEHAAAGRGAGQVRVVVRVAQDRLEPHRGVRFEEAQGFVASLEEGLHARIVVSAGHGGAQVGARLLQAVLNAGLAHLVVGRDPHHAARDRGRTANAVAAFDQQHARALGGGGARGRHAGRAGADHDDVVGLVRGIPYGECR
jgi:hypothetical protein